ncbi:MAG: transposase, partial [Chloroflexi bacterium]|nr:transposase [Chloroflexota bacterium]
MQRFMLTDGQWEQVEPLLPGRKGSPCWNGDNNRKSLKGMLRVLRTGAPWRH